MYKILSILGGLLLLLNTVLARADNTPQLISAADLASFPNPVANARIAYGDDPLQFADLRVPAGPGPHPVMILIHGGCWLAEYDIAHAGKLADAFARNGIATWTLEYRRVGNAGGGWPGTLQDIAKGADHLLKIASDYSLDSKRIIVAGHSAGGHLALWLAAREKLTHAKLFASEQSVKLQGVLALAPAADLAYLHNSGVCDNVIDKLMGGSPQALPERYALASIPQLVPLALPQILVIGAHDKSWREVGYRYYEFARKAGDDVEIINAADSGHFEMIDPDSTTWPVVRNAAYKLLGMPIPAN